MSLLQEHAFTSPEASPGHLLPATPVGAASLPGPHQHAAPPATGTPQRWMASLPSSTGLDELTIPGTHDSGALHGGRWITCQHLGLAEQLAAGVRYLDVRVHLTRGRFAIHHGHQFQRLVLDDVLDTCREFLRENPSETVMVSLMQEFRRRGTAEVAREWAAVRSRVADVLLERRRIPRLAEARGRVVLVSRDPAVSGLDHAAWQVHDDWHVHNRDAWQARKWPGVTDHLRRARAARGDGRLWSCHATSTGWALAPRGAAQLVEQGLRRHFEELGPRPAGTRPERNGIVLLDFPSEGLLATLWQRNL